MCFYSGFTRLSAKSVVFIIGITRLSAKSVVLFIMVLQGCLPQMLILHVFYKVVRENCCIYCGFIRLSANKCALHWFYKVVRGQPARAQKCPASPRPLARTKRNDFPVGFTPPTSNSMMNTNSYQFQLVPGKSFATFVYEFKNMPKPTTSRTKARQRMASLTIGSIRC